MARCGRTQPPTVARIVCICVFCAWIFAPKVQTTFCLPCDGVCDPVEHCVNGIVMDSCGCCEVCAKEMNETCGGPRDVLGKCGEGLVCYLSPPENGAQIYGDEPGLCRGDKPTKLEVEQCDTFACADSTPHMDCPWDSYQHVKFDNASRQCCNNSAISVCECNRTLCLSTECRAGYVQELVHESNNFPGQCCNFTTCVLSDECGSIVCPEEMIDEVPCPDDSYQPVSVISEDGCCEIKQRCKCKEECPTRNCTNSTKLQILSKGTGQIGSCCDNIKCIDEKELWCTSDGNVYKNNETWSVDKCTLCTCKDGIKLCQAEACPDLSCGWMTVPEGSCCPVCSGCVSQGSHQLYNNTDTWKEDKCTQCLCLDGQTSCVSETCQIKCVKPKYTPERCCPACDDADQAHPEQLNECGVDACLRVCPVGRRLDSRGCPLCGCKADKCGLQCKQGLVIDSDGNEVCRCNKTPHICQPLIGCTKDCIYGFKKSRYGCNKCRCNKCPLFHCTKKCLNGYIMNDKGCEICKCRDAKTPPTTTFLSNTVSCLSDSGLLHGDGESWHDGCRRCFCHGGKEMCYLIRCASLVCSNPVFRFGDCCPSCIGVVTTSTKRPMMEQCRTIDGQHFTEGETWQMDKCTECICHEGLILCETQACAPLLCHYPKKQADECCAKCQVENTTPSVSSLQPRSCYTNRRVSYKHGEVWRVNPCQSCTCKHGLIHCYSQMCAPLKCPRITLHKGQCCPTCLDDNDTVPCVSGENTYSVGEEWSENCLMCQCREGGVRFCVNVTCSLLTCFVLVRKPGTCCPVCLENSGFSLNGQHKIYPFPDTIHDHTHAPHTPHDQHLLTIGVLSVLFIVVVIVMVILVIIVLRRRKRKHFKANDRQNVLPSEFRSRPKSTNLDLQGATPFLFGFKSKPYQYDGKIVRTQESHGQYTPETGNLIDTGEKWNTGTTDTSLSSTLSTA